MSNDNTPENKDLDPNVQAVVNALNDRSRFEPSFIKRNLNEKSSLSRVEVRSEPATQVMLEEVQEVEQTEDVLDDTIVVDIYEENGEIIGIDNGVLFINEELPGADYLESYCGSEYIDDLINEAADNYLIERGLAPRRRNPPKPRDPNAPTFLQRVGRGFSNLFGRRSTPTNTAVTTAPSGPPPANAPAETTKKPGLFANIGSFLNDTEIGKGIKNVVGDAIKTGIGSKLQGGSFSQGAKAGALGSFLGQTGQAAYDDATGRNNERGGQRTDGGGQGGQGGQGGPTAGRIPVRYYIDNTQVGKDQYSKERSSGGLDQDKERSVTFRVRNRGTNEVRAVTAQSDPELHAKYMRQLKANSEIVQEELIRLGAVRTQDGWMLNGELLESVYTEVTQTKFETPYYYDSTGRLRTISESEFIKLSIAQTILERAIQEAMDEVGKEDKDVNNDGKVNSSDDYLKNRREKIAAKMKEKMNENKVFTEQQAKPSINDLQPVTVTSKRSTSPYSPINEVGGLVSTVKKYGEAGYVHDQAETPETRAALSVAKKQMTAAAKERGIDPKRAMKVADRITMRAHGDDSYHVNRVGKDATAQDLVQQHMNLHKEEVEQSVESKVFPWRR